MKNKIEKIRKACIAANPEIVELKFGCEYKDFDSDLIKILTEKPNYDSQTVQYYVVSEFADIHSYIKEIIGRPITLADVLMAIPRSDWAVDVQGRFLKLSMWHWKLTGVKWNLALPLSGQSEETIDFLIEILDRE